MREEHLTRIDYEYWKHCMVRSSGGRRCPRSEFLHPALRLENGQDAGAARILAPGHRRSDASPDGGVIKRQNAEHRGIASYISVASVSEWAAKVQKLGGQVCVPKTAVPGMGHFAMCQDTEGNMFGLWETDPNAK
jgi:predicted enzyme related to lactoylglutathione lyase